jgi:histone H3/H4
VSKRIARALDEENSSGIFGSATTIIAASTAALGLIVSVLSAFFTDESSGNSNPPPEFSWTPVAVVAASALAIAIVAVSFLAARAAIRRREGRRDAIQNLLSRPLEASGEGLSPQARNAYTDAVEMYAQSILELAKQNYKRDGSDIVSQRHIERAAEFVGTGYASKRGRHLGAIGGVLLGTGFSVWSDIFIDGKYAPIPLAISLMLTIAGVALVVYNWVRD